MDNAIDLKNRHLDNQAKHHGGLDISVRLGNLTRRHPPGDGALQHPHRAGHIRSHFPDITVMVEQQVAEKRGVGVIKRAEQVDDGGQLVFQGLVLLLAAIQVHSQFHVVFRKEFPSKVIFAGVVEVKGALGNPCRPSDILSGGGRDPLFHKEAQGDVVDQFLGLAGISLHSDYSLIYLTFRPSKCPCQAFF